MTFCFTTATEHAKDLHQESSMNPHFKNSDTKYQKWKSRLVEAHFIPGIDSEADKAEVLALSLQRLGVLGAFQTDRKPTKIRRRITIETRRTVCDMIRAQYQPGHLIQPN